jgi:bacterioferritin-associated ferredoxin
MVMKGPVISEWPVASYGVLEKELNNAYAQGRQSLEGRVKELEAEVAGIYSQCPGCQRLEAEVEGLKSQLAASRGADKWEQLAKHLNERREKTENKTIRTAIWAILQYMVKLEASLEAGAPEGEK